MTMRRLAVVLALTAGVALSGSASAHCDTTNGPVVTAAHAALEAGDPNLVLHWVRPEDESTVTAAFRHTMEVRALGPEAKALADRYFFETLVRIHRAGEGAPYTGLTDGDPEPIIAATDRALQRGSTEELDQQLVGAVKSGLAERFAAASAAKNFRPGDVARGRAFVAAYVPLTHWVEGVFTAAHGSGEHHAPMSDHAATSHSTVHEPEGRAVKGGAAESHAPSELQHVPWMLTGLLALTAFVEGAFLLKRRHQSSTAVAPHSNAVAS